MSGATRRSRGRPRKNQTAHAATTHINSFTRVSKQATVNGKDLCNDITATTPSARKRKAARSPEPEPEEVTTTTTERKIATATSKSSKKARLVAPEPKPHTHEQQPPSTPRPKSTKKRALSPLPEESPRTREAGNLFKRLRIDASPFPRTARTYSPLIPTNSTVTRTSTPARSVFPDSDDEDNDADSSNLTTPEPEQQQLLPQELLDLVSLYSAFLKTIVVHYAHNGINTPVDLRHISQAVGLAWGKRRISLADVRRCVGVMDVASSSVKSPFYLVDYGSKKVCVELRDEQHGRPLDEDRLVRAFEDNLRGLWGAVKDAASEDMAIFVLGLPKAPVQSCESVAKASPLLVRGQRAMKELKAGMAAKKDEKEAAKASVTTTPTSGDAPKLSLLERLRLKESQLAALAGTGPTAAELERRAALQRADDVAAVVAMLARSAASAGTGGRASFTMVTVLQKLKDSLRLPISKDEGTACVRLLAGEVAPEWLRIVTIGARENVVVTVARAPSTGVLAERVRMLSAWKGAC